MKTEEKLRLAFFRKAEDKLRFAFFHAILNVANLDEGVSKHILSLTGIPTRREGVESRGRVWQNGYLTSIGYTDLLLLRAQGYIPEEVVAGCPLTKEGSLRLDALKKRWIAAINEAPDVRLVQAVHSLYHTDPAHQLFQNMYRFCGISEDMHLAWDEDNRKHSLNTTNCWMTQQLRNRSSYTDEQREMFRQDHAHEAPPPFAPRPLGYVF